MTALLDWLRELGQRSIEQREATKVAVRDAQRREEVRDFAARVEIADRLLRKLLGSARPDKSRWLEWGSGMLILPLGEPDEFWVDRTKYDGPEGEIIFRRSPDRLWYRPRLHNDSIVIEDAAHLGRMIIERSIYA